MRNTSIIKGVQYDFCDIVSYGTALPNTVHLTFICILFQHVRKGQNMLFFDYIFCYFFPVHRAIPPFIVFYVVVVFKVLEKSDQSAILV